MTSNYEIINKLDILLEKALEADEHITAAIASRDSTIAALRKRVEIAERYVNHIAKQKLSGELPEEEQNDADFEGAYDAIIEWARTASSKLLDGELVGKKGE